MANITTLRVYHAALAQLRDLAQRSDPIRFGDLANQLRRAAISVVGNLAEGSSRGSDAEYARFVAIARASNTEIAAHLAILAALGGPDVTTALAANASIGRQLSGLIRYLRGSGG